MLFLRRSSASIFVDRDLLHDSLRFELDERRRRPKSGSILTNFFEVILPPALADPHGWPTKRIRRLFFSRPSRDELLDYLSRHYPQWNSLDVPRPISTDRTSLMIVEDLIGIHDPHPRPKAVRPPPTPLIVVEDPVEIDEPRSKVVRRFPTLRKVYRRAAMLRGRMSLQF